MKIKNNTVYLCKTHALARQFLQECEQQGYSWLTSKKATQVNDWEKYKEVAFYIERGDLYYGAMTSVDEDNDGGLPVIEYNPTPKQTIVIKTDGNTVTAYMGDKRGIAKCNPDDTFDLYTGARLALDRLFDNRNNCVREVARKAKVGEYIKVVRESHTSLSRGKYTNGDICRVIDSDVSRVVAIFNGKEAPLWHREYVVLENYKPTEQVQDQFVPHLISTTNGDHYGTIGTPTKYKDAAGRPLFVGDVVKIFRCGYCSIESVVQDDTKQFVMGICGSCNDKLGKIEDWEIIKIRDYKEVSDGEIIRTIRYVKSKK